MRILKDVKTYPRRGETITAETIQITEKVVCDKCKTVLWDAYKKMNKDFFSATATWGKTPLEDIHLCQSCYLGIFTKA